MKKVKFLLISFLNVAFFNTEAQITVTGNDWVPIIDASVVTEAGTDYATGYSIESDVAQSEIDASPLLGGIVPLFNWRVNVSMTSIANWHNDLKLSVRRSGDGTGTAIIQKVGIVNITLASASINGGQNYQNVTLAPTTFFTGSASYQDVPIQYKISGLSVLIPTKTYSTEVLYTFIGL